MEKYSNDNLNSFKILKIKFVDDFHTQNSLNKLFQNVKGILSIYRKKHKLPLVEFSTEDHKIVAKKTLRLIKNKKGKNLLPLEIDKTDYHLFTLLEKRAKIKRKKTASFIEKKKKLEINDICDVVTKYHKLPYKKQLSKKFFEVKKRILNMTQLIAHESSSYTYNWKNKHYNLCCKILDIEPSPTINNYRNKDSHSIGYDKHGKTCIGYYAGKFKDNESYFLSPEKCIHIPESFKALSNHLLDLVNSSKFKAFNLFNREGVWRRVTYKSSILNKELQMIIIIKNDHLTKDETNEIKKSILDHFCPNKPHTNNELEEMQNVECKSSTNITYQNSQRIPFEHNGFKLKSIILQINNGLSNSLAIDSDWNVLFGSKTIKESLNGFKFDISPNSFFQINTKGAENLYKYIVEVSGCDENTVILDICCGTGTIGIHFAKKCKKVIGFEMIEDGINDAIKNSELNQIKNTVWIKGDVTETISNGLKKHCAPNDNVIAVVDPSRAGLSKDVLKCLRQTKEIKKIIYVSCKLKSLTRDVSFLVKAENKKDKKGVPFHPVNIKPFDIFPHTELIESVMILDRCLPNEVPVKIN